MSILKSLTCEACNKSTVKLTQNEVLILMPEVKGWQVIVDDGLQGSVQKLVRIISTKNFKESMALCQKIAGLAETVNHHPLIIVEYSSITVQWWTHVIQGLHHNDFIMANKTSALIEAANYISKTRSS